MTVLAQAPAAAPAGVGGDPETAVPPRNGNELRDQIDACTAPAQFAGLFRDVEPYLDNLEQITVNDGLTREDMTKEWAKRLSRKDASSSIWRRANERNEDRRIVKKFLMAFCNIAYDYDSVIEERGTNTPDFGGLNTNYIIRMMRALLVSDRANAWYCLPNARHGRGKHWYAQNANVPDDWVHVNGPGGHTINRRFLWLQNDGPLELDEDMVDLLKPQPSPNYPRATEVNAEVVQRSKLVKCCIGWWCGFCDCLNQNLLAAIIGGTITAVVGLVLGIVIARETE